MSIGHGPTQVNRCSEQRVLSVNDHGLGPVRYWLLKQNLSTNCRTRLHSLVANSLIIPMMSLGFLTPHKFPYLHCGVDHLACAAMPASGRSGQFGPSTRRAPWYAHAHDPNHQGCRAGQYRDDT